MGGLRLSSWQRLASLHRTPDGRFGAKSGVRVMGGLKAGPGRGLRGPGAAQHGMGEAEPTDDAGDALSRWDCSGTGCGRRQGSARQPQTDSLATRLACTARWLRAEPRCYFSAAAALAYLAPCKLCSLSVCPRGKLPSSSTTRRPRGLRLTRARLGRRGAGVGAVVQIWV